MKMKTKLHANDKRMCWKSFVSNKGFSLPEVAIAIGIAGMALLSLVGLIPTLSDTDRVNGLNSMVPQMTTRALAELRSKDLSSLTNGATFTFYFSETGDLALADGLDRLFRCVAQLKEIPDNAIPTDPADGGVPQVNGKTCVVKLEFALESEAKSKTQTVYAGLRL